jgi:hypothetical protein
VNNLIIGGGGVVLGALVAAGFTANRANLLGEALIAAGLYFVCGLLLIGWSHVTLLDTLWRGDGLTMPAALARQWPGWLALILVAVALIALIAPRSYALDPIAILVWLVFVLTSVVQLIIFLIALPFLWLASLLGMGGASSGPPPSAAVPPAAGAAQGIDIPFWETLRSLGFWFITLALAVYAVRTLYQSRWGMLRLLPGFAPWAALVRLWRAVVGGLRARAATLADILRAGSAARALAGAALHRPRRAPRPTDPRGLIQFLYLSLIERAGQRGYSRRRGMTAAEYSRYLTARLTTLEASAAANAPDPATARADLDALTAAFMEARYSRRAIEESEAGLARRALSRLLALIRRPRRQ